MVRLVEDVVNGPNLYHSTQIHNSNLFTDFRHHAQVVGDEQHGHLVLFLQTLQEFQEHGLDRDIDRRRGFVGDEQIRFGGQCNRDERAL